MPLIVEDDDEDVLDSRTGARPGSRERAESDSGSKFMILLLVTGGLLGLGCPGRSEDLAASVMLGEWDDIEVGVDIRLSAPGDSERRVEEELEFTKLGVGGGRLCVDIE